MPDSLTETVLKGRRIVLEPIGPAHAEALFEALQASTLYTYIPHDSPKSLDTLRARYTRWALRGSPDGADIWLNYAVVDAETTRYVGTVQATVVPGGKTYIAYQIFPRFQRRGFARSSLEVLIGFLFATWPLDRLHALVDTRNVASWKTMESLGFRRIGLVLNADFFKGSPSDEYAYEIPSPRTG